MPHGDLIQFSLYSQWTAISIYYEVWTAGWSFTLFGRFWCNPFYILWWKLSPLHNLSTEKDYSFCEPNNTVMEHPGLDINKMKKIHKLPLILLGFTSNLVFQIWTQFICAHVSIHAYTKQYKMFFHLFSDSCRIYNTFYSKMKYDKIFAEQRRDLQIFSDIFKTSQFSWIPDITWQ